MKESIFKNGYVKKGFLNPNYRGLVGWPTDNGGKILAVQFEKYLFEDGHHTEKVYTVNREFFNLKQFTPQDIPIGELCWFGDDNGGWTLSVFSGGYFLKNLKEHRFSSRSIVFDFCIPYLIAETEEDAERLKDWSEE